MEVEWRDRKRQATSDQTAGLEQLISGRQLGLVERRIYSVYHKAERIQGMLTQ